MAGRIGDRAHKLAIVALVVIPLAGVFLALRMHWQRAAGWDDVALMIGL